MKNESTAMLTLNAFAKGARRLPDVDSKLRAGIDELTAQEDGFWDFNRGIRSSYERAPFQYPAMMVPALQRELVQLLVRLQPTIQTIGDPFVGSGTVLCEAMLCGKDFIGQDINPLAILISRMRASAFDVGGLTDVVTRCIARAERNCSNEYIVKFPNQSKWFGRGANVALSRLRSAIQQESSPIARKFLWIALAETIRVNSNSRTSTYKLHIRPKAECNFMLSDVLQTFKSTCGENLCILAEFALMLKALGRLEGHKYRQKVRLALGDSTESFGWGAVGNKLDMVMTSPPYGDNKSTVPYGQAAWLPLQWIDHNDIEPGDRVAKLIASTHQVDTLSLGGRSNKRSHSARAQELCDKSISFRRAHDMLAQQPCDGIERLVSFGADLSKAMATIADACADNAYLVWTLGHRRIRTVEWPLTDIISDLFAHHGIKEVHRIARAIPTKRMACRNSISATMRDETILILRRQPTPGH